MNNPERYFTSIEAQAKIGKAIQTAVAFSRVPAGTTGTVVGQSAHNPSEDQYTVAVQWDLPEDARARANPLVDWFSKDEYEKYLNEV